MIDVVSAVCCLSFTERGRRIRRRWLTTTGTSFVGGTAGGTTAHSEMSSMLVRQQFVQQSDLDQRRKGWSSRRSYTASELIGKQKTKATPAPVNVGNHVWNDLRQSSRTSNEAPMEKPSKTAYATLHGQASEAIDSVKLKPEIECAPKKPSTIRDYGCGVIEKPEMIMVGSGATGDVNNLRDTDKRQIDVERISMLNVTKPVPIGTDVNEFYHSKQMRTVATISTCSPAPGTDECRQHGRSPSADNSTVLGEQLKVHSISLPDLTTG